MSERKNVIGFNRHGPANEGGGGGGMFRNNVILIYSFVGSDRFSSDLMDHDRLAVFSIMDPDVGITLKGGTR